MDAIKNKLKMSKKSVQSRYELLKKSKKIDLSSLKELLFHCNTIPELIEKYLDTLIKEKNENDFHYSLLFYYPILSVETCSNFNIKKTISEKERFFKLIDNFLTTKNITELRNLVKNEVHNKDEIIHFIQKDDYKALELNDFSRWFNCYNTPVDYKNEENEEYLFYNLSNNLISEFNRSNFCFQKRISLFNKIIDLFKEIELRRKEEKFCDYFEFLCILITNGEIDDTKKEENIDFITSLIKEEIDYKFMNLEEHIF